MIRKLATHTDSGTAFMTAFLDPWFLLFDGSALYVHRSEQKKWTRLVLSRSTYSLPLELYILRSTSSLQFVISAAAEARDGWKSREPFSRLSVLSRPIVVVNNHGNSIEPTSKCCVVYVFTVSTYLHHAVG